MIGRFVFKGAGAIFDHSPIIFNSAWNLSGRSLIQADSSSKVRMEEGPDLNGLDVIQRKLLEEECILVTEEDRPVGSASKKICHLMSNIDKGMLHRAFSVFLFNTAGELLLQQRSKAKITFPGHWTNTCCSHPLSLEGELDEREAMGVKRAAQRKLKHELGIEPHQVPLEKFNYLTRIHYKSANVPADGTWGEHELDYILVIRCDVDLRPNTNEVMSHRYVNKSELAQLMELSSESRDTLITPWFRLIVDSFLTKWWDNLDNISICADRNTIHRMC